MAGLITLGALGAGLSVDAFAAAIGKGAVADAAGRGEHRLAHALRIGAVFGFFEAITPAIGWAVGLALSGWISSVDHWIAFTLLGGVGINMIWHALRREDAAGGSGSGGGRRGGVTGLVLTALATSIDATAVGVSLGVMHVDILAACLVIGGITTVVATIGVLLGRHAGVWLGRYAEVLGGVALMIIGTVILVQHLSGMA